MKKNKIQRTETKGHKFEVHDTGTELLFYEKIKGRSEQSHALLGSVTYSAHGDILNIQGSITISQTRFEETAIKDPKRFKKLSLRDILTLKKKLLVLAGKAVFVRYPEIKSIAGGIFDTRSRMFLSGETLFKILKGKITERKVLSLTMARKRRQYRQQRRILPRKARVA